MKRNWIVKSLNLPQRYVFVSKKMWHWNHVQCALSKGKQFKHFLTLYGYVY